jgi:hypothetical protein
MSFATAAIAAAILAQPLMVLTLVFTKARKAR